MEDFKSLSVSQVLERGADAVPDKTAAIDGEEKKTYKELNHMADAMAASFSDCNSCSWVCRRVRSISNRSFRSTNDPTDAVSFPLAS